MVRDTVFKASFDKTFGEEESEGNEPGMGSLKPENEAAKGRVLVK